MLVPCPPPACISPICCLPAPSVKPDPPEDLRVSPIPGETKKLLLEWSPPGSWPFPEYFPLKYRIRYAREEGSVTKTVPPQTAINRGKAQGRIPEQGCVPCCPPRGRDVAAPNSALLPDRALRADVLHPDGGAARHPAPRPGGCQGLHRLRGVQRLEPAGLGDTLDGAVRGRAGPASGPPLLLLRDPTHPVRSLPVPPRSHQSPLAGREEAINHLEALASAP